MGRRYRTNAEHAAMVRRMILSLGRRAASGDPDDLALVLDLARTVNEAAAAAVAGLRDAGFVWESIAEATGTTRQAACMRWGPRSETVGPG